VELKRIITKFTYRIESKPEGGFIAHASDPSLPPLEAPTRLELQQKIQANISAALAEEFPGLKLSADNQQLKLTSTLRRSLAAVSLSVLTIQTHSRSKARATTRSSILSQKS